MCGIHLFINKGSNTEEGKNVIDRMLFATKHRGPDGMAWKHLDWDEEQIWLGHNLLAISETVENSVQPMVGGVEEFGLIFNGQVYNHLELRTQLIAEGYIFKSNSDTETLLYWIKAFGRKGLRKLKGMFAFVFWDTKKRLLIIHRDNYGIKPLYYFRNRHNFIVSSEQAGILASAKVDFKLDQNSISELLQFRFLPSSNSPWIGLKEINPGEVIEYWEGKPMHYVLPNEKQQATFSTLKESIAYGFKETIPRNMAVGLMLSGGIDSTIILNYCIENKIQVVPYSVKFKFGTEDDLADQEAVEYLSKMYNIPICWVEITKADVEFFLEAGIKTAPFVADPAWFLTKKIAERAKMDGIKILLSGAGADEWFGGYRRHWFFYQWSRFESFIPNSIKKHILRVGLKNFRFSNGDKLNSWLIWKMSVSSGLLSSLIKKSNLNKPKTETDFSLNDALSWDQIHFLVNDVLKITDLATMSHGIEGRFPFLHPSITNYANQFSGNEIMSKGRKWMLKNELKSIVDTKFLNRKKRGFGLPLGVFFTSDQGKKITKKAMDDLNSSVYFKQEVWEKTKEELISNPQKWALELYTICFLSKWLQDQNGVGRNLPLV